MGNQAISKREQFFCNRFGLGTQRPRLAFADAVIAKVRTENSVGGPAQIKLGIGLLSTIKPADIGGVVRHAAHAVA